MGGTNYMAAGLRYGTVSAQEQLEKVASPFGFMKDMWRGVNGMQSVTRGGGLGAVAGALGGAHKASKVWGHTPEMLAALRKTVDAEKGATVLSGAAADAKRQLDLLGRFDAAGIDAAARKSHASMWDYVKANPDKRTALLGAALPSIGASAAKGAAAGAATHATVSGAKSALHARAMKPYLMPAAVGGGALLGYGLGSR